MDIKEMIATIEIYIFVRTGVEVPVRPILPIEMPKVLLAYGIANRWLKANKVTIIHSKT